MRILALTAVLLAACGSKSNEAAEPAAADPAATEPAGPPAPAETAEPAGDGAVDPEWKRVGDKAVALMRKLHTVATTNASNCDAMADGLVAMVDENKAFSDEAKSYQNNAEFNDWFSKTYQEELSRLLQELTPALMGCQDNAKFQAAFQKFQS